MNCREVEEQDILERYILDHLNSTDRDSFEQHYFGCDSCFSKLQIELAVREELQRHAPLQARAGGAFLRQIWSWGPALVVCVLLLVVAAWRYTARREQPRQESISSIGSPQAVNQARATAPSLDELARVEPPPYNAMLLRGPEDEAGAKFDRAMQRYSKGDYAGAISGLRAAVKADPENSRFNFYLGASYLITGQIDPAISCLQKVITLNDSSYREPAHFYLAKAYLKTKNILKAEEQLRATADLAGGNAVEARELLRQLGK